MLGLLAGLLLAAVAAVVAEVAAPSPAAGQSAPPTLSLSPRCSNSSSVKINFSGTNWPYYGGGEFPVYVTVTFDGAEVAQVETQSGGTIAGSFTISTTSGAHDVQAFEDWNGSSAYQPFRVPCPSVRITPTCGPVATARGQTWSITVEMFNFLPQYDAYIAFQGVRLADGGTDGSGYWRTEITPSRGPAGTYTVAASDYVYAASARFTAPCPTATTTSSSTTTSTTVGTTTSSGPTTSTPAVTLPPLTTTTTIFVPPPTPGVTLVADPPIGPHGFVTTVRGSGFQPGPVTVGWAPGIGQVVAEAGLDGSFAVPLLVMPGDALGPRQVVAVGAERSGSAGFLAVPGTVKPSGRDVAQISQARRLLSR